MSKFFSSKRPALLFLLLSFGPGCRSACAEGSSQPVTQKQIAAETTFLNQTKAFNQQLLITATAMHQIHTRREFDELDKRERREQKLKLNEWFQARDICFRAGVKDDPKIWPELNRELTLTYRLLDELTRLVHSFVPEMDTPGADPF